MFRNIWKGNSKQKRARKTAFLASRIRPELGLRIESLEGRAMLSGAGVDAGIASDPATHLAVFTPPVALAGTAVPVVVVALNANNVPTSDFTGEISLNSTDGTALVSTSLASAGSAVPFDYTFQSSNDGHQLFFITYGANTSGAQTLTASDTTDSTITDDTANTNVVTPAAATHFAVIVKPNVQVGAPASVLVEALDAQNHVVPNYDGTVTISSSDPAAVSPFGPPQGAPGTMTDDLAGIMYFPLTYTFNASNRGRLQIEVTFNTPGSQTISADDSTNSLTGTGTTNVNAPAVATHFAVQVAPNTLVGVPTTVNVLALDANNHIVPNYAGPVTFAVNNDATATLPAGYTFQASDHGHTSFQVTFDTPGPETITVADSTNTVTGTASTNVVPAPVATQFLVIMPPSIPAGVPVQVIVVPLDASGHPVPNYTGTISFGSSDLNASLPPNYTFGQSASPIAFHAFAVTFEITGEQSLTVTDINVATTIGTASIDVTAAVVATSLQIEAPQNAPVGVPLVVRVVVLDANGNRIPNFDGQITLTTSDPAAKIVPLAALLPGGVNSNLFAVVFGTPGPQTLTATDAADSLSTDVSVNVLAGILDPPASTRWT